MKRERLPVKTDNTKKFSGKAAVYADARPEYPEEVYRILFEDYGFARRGAIADFGAGTGKFTQGLAGRGVPVYAVEPNADMISVLRKRLGCGSGIEIVRSAAEHTPLADGSVGCVTAAQAFHWFSAEEFRAECLRICGGDCLASVIYHRRKRSPLHDDIFELTARCCPEFKGFSGGCDRERIDDFFHGNDEVFTVEHPLYYDKETFVKRCLSSSYALTERDAGFDEFLRGLRSLFEKYAEDGTLCFPNEVEITIGRLKK